MSSTSKPPFKSTLAGSVLMAAAFSAVVFGLRASSAWNAYFSQPGAAYVNYHILRTVFFLFMSWLVYYLGHLTLRLLSMGKPGEDADIVANCFAGASVLTVVMLVLGLANALDFPVLFTGSVLLFAASWSHLARLTTAALQKGSPRSGLPAAPWPQRLVRLALWGLTGACGAYVFLAKGLGPDVGGVGGEVISYYFPYLYEVQATKGLWPNSVFSTYYVVKGAGVLLLFSALSDVQSLSLATFLFYLLIAVMLYRSVRLMTDEESPFPIVAVLVFFCSMDTFLANFAKSHIIHSAYTVAMAWFSWSCIATPRSSQSATRKAMLLTAMNAGMLPLINVFFGAAALCLPAAAAAFLPRRSGAARDIGAAILALFAATATMCAVNYAVTGFLDITGFPAQLRFANQGAVSRWASPLMMDFYRQIFSIHNASITLDSFLSHMNPENLRYFFWNKVFLPYVLVVPLFALAALTRRGRSGQSQDATLVFWTSIALLAVPFLVASLYSNDHYFSHGTVYFKDFLKSLAYAAMLAAITRAAMGLVGNPALARLAPTMLALAAAVAALLHYPHNWGDDMREVFEFTSGKASYEARYTRFYVEIPLCKQITADIGGEGGLVLPLNHTADCNGLPGSIFVDTFYPPYSRDFDAFADARPDKAEHALRRVNIRYLLINLQEEPQFSAFLPLFSPESLAARFRLVKDYGNGVFLLAWADSETAVDLPGDLAGRWTRYLEKYAGTDAAAIGRSLAGKGR